MMQREMCKNNKRQGTVPCLPHLLLVIPPGGTSGTAGSYLGGVYLR